MKEILTEFIGNEFDHSKVVPISKITFDNEVRKLCEQNMCGTFGKCWTCPPAVDSIEDLQAGLEPFSDFRVFYKVYQLEDSFDWEGMTEGMKDFQSRILKLKKLIGKESDDFLVLGAGSCQICDECTYPEDPCRLPELAMYSVEAYGIDAMKMMADNGLQYNNGPNTVTYIGGLFFTD